ncbi:MAG TPA: hypothetical protein VFB88_20945 [Xanthobacteraceae bacterium]|nr:hypothetical protein [Xanthobacteraceae bacterium]
MARHKRPQELPTARAPAGRNSLGVRDPETIHDLPNRKQRYDMPRDETDINGDAELRRKQAKAMLDLFEWDRRRAAVALEEVREWAAAQDEDHLLFRVNRHLDCEWAK